MRPVLLACLALAACSKSPEPAAESTNAPAPKEISVGEIPAAAIAKAEAVVAQVEAKSSELTADATKLYTDAVAKAKAYLGEQKFDQALASLDSLKDVVLSADQQKIVTDLRAQITKAQDLYKQAQGATKNLFGK